MANQITQTSINAKTLVSGSSRYRNSSVIYYGSNNKLTFETYKRNAFVSSQDDRFAVIPPDQEFRPDITSNKVYGTPSFWWRIMEINGIFDIFDYKAGINVRLPTKIL